MKKFFRITLWVVIALIVAGTFVYLYMNSQPKDERYAEVVPVIDSIERSTVLTGKIEPRDEIEIKPQISGIITEIAVEAGDLVHEGDVIARIKVIPEASQLSSAMSRVNNARIELDNARVRYERDRDLYRKKIVARQDFEDSEKTYLRAKEELESAEDAYNIVREGVSRHNASESNTLVRATITGLVLDVPVKVGSSVIQANTMNDGTTVATVADMSNLIFRGNVDETEVGHLSVGMPMNIVVGAMPEMHPVGRIEYISPKGKDNGGANTFEIKAALDIDDPTGLRAGYSANANVILAKADSVVTIPEGAITFVGDSTFVYVMTDSVPVPAYERRAIVTGLSDGIKIEVKEGINTADRLRGDKIN